jgi:hypothetical protein
MVQTILRAAGNVVIGVYLVLLLVCILMVCFNVLIVNAENRFVLLQD